MKRSMMTLIKSLIAVSAIFAISSCKSPQKSDKYHDYEAKVSYLASFNTQGGSAVESQYFDVINEMPISSKKGFALKGWYIESEDNLVTFPYTLNKDTTFNASWEKAAYSCAFDTDGGTQVETIVGVNVINESPVTTKEGYEFVGWHIDSEMLDEIVSFPLVLIDNITLYAEWKKQEITPHGELLAVAKVDAMESKSYWSFEYLEENLHVHAEVSDPFLYTYYTNAGMNDNVEIVLTPENRNYSAGYIAGNTYHFLCDADGKGYYNFATSAYEMSGDSPIPSSCYIDGRAALLDDDGFNGFIVDFYIAYSLFGLNRASALNNMTMTVGMRNTNSYTATNWGAPLYNDYLSCWSWSLLKEDGTFEGTDVDASAVIVGGSNFAIANYHDINATLSANNTFVYSREDELENWENEAKNVSLYNADKIILNIGRYDYYKGDLTNDELVTAVIDFAKYYVTAFGASNIYVTSIEPLKNFVTSLSKLQTINNNIKNQCLANGINYIDTYSLFVTGSTLKTEYFSNNFVFSSSGFEVYYDLIKTYL